MDGLISLIVGVISLIGGLISLIRGLINIRELDKKCQWGNFALQEMTDGFLNGQWIFKQMYSSTTHNHL